MTWLMTWSVASCQGMRFPLCQILEVVWMGMRVEVLLRPRRARILNKVSRFAAACHGAGCVRKPVGFEIDTVFTFGGSNMVVWDGGLPAVWTRGRHVLRFKP
jgi:hypothetical protein